MIVKFLSYYELLKILARYQPWVAMGYTKNGLNGLYIVSKRQILISKELNLFWQLETFIHEFTHHICNVLKVPFRLEEWFDQVCPAIRYFIKSK